MMAEPTTKRRLKKMVACERLRKTTRSMVASPRMLVQESPFVVPMNGKQSTH